MTYRRTRGDSTLSHLNRTDGHAIHLRRERELLGQQQHPSSLFQLEVRWRLLRLVRGWQLPLPALQLRSV